MKYLIGIVVTIVTFSILFLLLGIVFKIDWIVENFKYIALADVAVIITGINVLIWGEICRK